MSYTSPKLPEQRTLSVAALTPASLRQLAAEGKSVVGVVLEKGYDPHAEAYRSAAYAMGAALRMREALEILYNWYQLSHEARNLIWMTLKDANPPHPLIGTVVPDKA